MATDLTLRPFEPGDLPALQRIRAAAFAPVFASFRAMLGAEIAALALAEAEAGQAKLLDGICAAGSAHHVFVVLRDAVSTPDRGPGQAGSTAPQDDPSTQASTGSALAQDERIIGFVSFTVDAAARSGEIGLTAVHPDHSGRGIGSRMVGEALAKMKALGAALAIVGTGGDSSHEAARRAYAKAGFGPGIASVHLYRLL